MLKAELKISFQAKSKDASRLHHNAAYAWTTRCLSQTSSFCVSIGSMSHPSTSALLLSVQENAFIRCIVILLNILSTVL